MLRSEADFKLQFTLIKIIHLQRDVLDRITASRLLRPPDALY